MELSTVELQLLELLWNHGTMFEIGVVRTKECLYIQYTIFNMKKEIHLKLS